MPSLRYAQLVLVIMYMASPLMSRTSSGYLLIRCAFVPIAYPSLTGVIEPLRTGNSTSLSVT